MEFRSNVDGAEGRLMAIAHLKSLGKTDAEIEEYIRQSEEQAAQRPPQKRLSKEEIEALFDQEDEQRKQAGLPPLSKQQREMDERIKNKG